MKRLILIVVIGYILGIIWGQYLKISIAPLYILITIIYILYSIISKKHRKFKQFSIHRYFRYIKIFFNIKIILSICISSFISYQAVQNINKTRENMQKIYSEQEKISITGKIVSSKIEKDYKIRYEMQIQNKSKKHKVYIDIKNNNKEGKNTKSENEIITSYINKNEKINSINKYEKTLINKMSNNETKKIKDESDDINNLKYGDIIKVEGNFKTPEIQRNFYGFDYNEYLKQKNIIGTIEIENYDLLKTNEKSIYIKLQNYINNIKNQLYEMLPKDIASIFTGIVIGDKTNIDENIIENFKNSSLSHVLAVSGMNISFLIMGVSIFNKITGKRKNFILAIFIIIIYMIITVFSASIYRAGIMGILMLISKIIYRKSDIWTNLSTSLLILLLTNPFLLFDIGLQLSYLGTIGIILFQKTIFKTLTKYTYKIKSIKYSRSKIKNKIILKILEIISVTTSAQITITPILIYQFHSISTYFIISNLLVSIIIEPLFIISLIFLFSLIIFKPIASFLAVFIEIGYNILIKISYIGELPKAQILLTRPHLILIIIYVIDFSGILFYNKLKINKDRKSTFQRFKNIKAWAIFKLKLKKKPLLIIMILSIIFYNISYSVTPFYNIREQLNLQKLQIHFIDVGQGDSCLIITPQNKKILIDGGGSINENFDVGEKTLLPYLLNRRIKELDMVIISHFDQDHIRWDFNSFRKSKSKKHNNCKTRRRIRKSKKIKKYHKIKENKYKNSRKT